MTGLVKVTIAKGVQFMVLYKSSRGENDLRKYGGFEMWKAEHFEWVCRNCDTVSIGHNLKQCSICKSKNIKRKEEKLMLSFKLRTQLKKAFDRAKEDKKELFKLLKISETLGLEWDYRPMYGGGTAVQLMDINDIVIEFFTSKSKVENLTFNEDYFCEDYIATKVQGYSDEQLAEIRNEEALYGYEMPHLRVIQGYRKGA